MFPQLGDVNMVSSYLYPMSGVLVISSRASSILNQALDVEIKTANLSIFTTSPVRYSMEN